MQILTNALAAHAHLLQQDGIASVAGTAVADEQGKGAKDFAAAYGVEISDAGRQLQEAEKQRNDALLSDVPVPKEAIEVGEPIEPLKNEGPIFFLTDDNWAEVFSLATDMEAIESHLSSMIEDPKNYWNVGNLQELGKALNGYSHKQESAIRSGKDTYLQSIQDRLDMLDGDHQNEMLNKIRSMVGSVQRCIDIDWKSEWFQEDIESTPFSPLDLKDATTGKPKTYFGQSMAVYSYMQEMNRQSQELSIVDKMLGGDDAADGTLSAGSVRKKSSLEDGLAAYRHDRAIVHLIAEDAPADFDGPLNYGVRSDGTVVERPNEETHNSARGYDWAAIMKAYRQEHPELENAIRWERVG